MIAEPGQEGAMPGSGPGHGGAHDRQVAAPAMSPGLAVVTNHERDFDGIPGIAIKSWTMP